MTATINHADHCTGEHLNHWQGTREPMATCRGCGRFGPATPPPTGIPNRRPATRSVCPICTTRPPRDPRPGSRRGECRACWQALTRERPRKPEVIV